MPTIIQPLGLCLVDSPLQHSGALEVPFKSDAKRVIVDQPSVLRRALSSPPSSKWQAPEKKISTLRSQPLPLFPESLWLRFDLAPLSAYTDAFGDFTLKTTWIGLDRPGQLQHLCMIWCLDLKLSSTYFERLAGRTIETVTTS